MSLIELIAEFHSAKANGDPAKYVHVISVEKAHETARQLEAMQAALQMARETLVQFNRYDDRSPVVRQIDAALDGQGKAYLGNEGE